MKKFIYFLEESPNYPNELYAKDKNEVVSLLVNDGIERSSIKKIIDVEEASQSRANAQSQQPQVLDYDSRVYDNPNDFMNDMLNEAFMKANSNEAAREAAKEAVMLPKAQAPASESQPSMEARALESSPSPAPASASAPAYAETKFFEDNGIKFKLEDGKLYKKVWTDVSSAQDAEFRIVKKNTKKIVPKDSFILEKLEWVEL